MSRRLAIALVPALLFLSVAGGRAFAMDPATKRGSCSGGRGEWKLAVRQETAGTLRVHLEIESGAAGQAWQIFLSDNGVRFFAGTRVADDTGRVRVTKHPDDRSGHDQISASAVNLDTGVTCEGSLRY